MKGCHQLLISMEPMLYLPSGMVSTLVFHSFCFFQVLMDVGYYIFFLTVAPVSSLARWLRNVLRPRVMSTNSGTVKTLYDISCWFATNLTVNYFVMSFILLGLC